MNYHYPGHKISAGRTAGQLCNPYRFVQRDSSWFVEIGFGKSNHFTIDIADLGTLMNAGKSQIGSKSVVLDDETAVEVPIVEDRLVPTWTISGDGGIACRWPETKEKIRLNRLLLGAAAGARKIKPRNGDPYDLRRSNLEQCPTDLVPIHWPLETNPALEETIKAMHECHVVEAFPGPNPAEPDMNQYQLVEYNGERFYRMKAYGGEMFYFSVQDLSKVLQVANVKHPTWYKATIGSKSKEGYICCHPKTSVQPIYLHKLLKVGEHKPGESIDHCNWNKWDNRQANLRFVDQSTQNRNKTRPGEFANKTYDAVPKAQRPRFVSDVKANGKHNKGYVIDFPIQELPSHVRSVVKTNGGKSDTDYTVRSSRSSKVTTDQQMEHMRLVYNAFVDGSYFYSDGGVNKIVKCAILATAYGTQYPKDVPFKVSKIGFTAANPDKSKGIWRVGKCHMSVKEGRVKLPQSESTKPGESPKDALIRLYVRLLTLDPTVKVDRPLVDQVYQAMHQSTDSANKRPSTESHASPKRQRTD